MSLAPFIAATPPPIPASAETAGPATARGNQRFTPSPLTPSITSSTPAQVTRASSFAVIPLRCATRPVTGPPVTTRRTSTFGHSPLTPTTSFTPAQAAVTISIAATPPPAAMRLEIGAVSTPRAETFGPSPSTPPATFSMAAMVSEIFSANLKGITGCFKMRR